MEQNNLSVRQYMVEFDVPALSDEMIDLIPEQREHLDDLFTNGKLLTYTVSEDRTRAWAVFIAESESELISYIDDMPLTPFMEFDYHELMFYNTVHLMPAMSLN